MRGEPRAASVWPSEFWLSGDGASQRAVVVRRLHGAGIDLRVSCAKAVRQRRMANPMTASRHSVAVLLSLRRAADFERVLRTRSAVSGPHFALHHLGAAPSRPPRRAPRPLAKDCGDGSLSTRPVEGVRVAVDELPAPVDRRWLGMVVPKRHARRAVTRNLLKRQIRAVAGEHAERLSCGLWVVRLRAPFDRGRFVSAASEPLRGEARAELDGLFHRVALGR